MQIIERKVDEFDYMAVEKYLEKRKMKALAIEERTYYEQFPAQFLCNSTNQISFSKSVEPALSNWPVQINLVSKDAIFLKGQIY